MDSFVEKALYTSGGRNTGADRKDGVFNLGYKTQNFCRDMHKTKLIGRNCLPFRFHEIATLALAMTKFLSCARNGRQFAAYKPWL